MVLGDDGRELRNWDSNSVIENIMMISWHKELFD